MSRAIRTLIVDDEPLARQGMRVRLSRESDIEIVGESVDGPTAVEALLELKPDLVFLDIQMPGFDGFEVLSRTATEHLPAVVFVTAYDRYALRAFGVHALDYLLKPIAHRRFQEALRRARAELARNDDAGAADRLRALLEARDAERVTPEPSSRPAPVDTVQAYAIRFTVRDGDRFILLRAADIDWVEAAANYLHLHAGTRAFVMRMTMSELEGRLDPRRFARIHRSTLVNLDRVRSIIPEEHGEYHVELAPGTCLRVGRAYRDRVLGRREPAAR